MNVFLLSNALSFFSPFSAQSQSLRIPSAVCVLRASFTGGDASLLLKPIDSIKSKEYVGKVVSTRQKSLLIRIDEDTTDMFTGSFTNSDWVMWQGYWGLDTARSLESKIAVFVDMAQWLENYNITLRADFNNIDASPPLKDARRTDTGLGARRSYFGAECCTKKLSVNDNTLVICLVRTSYLSEESAYEGSTNCNFSSNRFKK